MTSENKVMKYKDGDYYFKIPNDRVISMKNWAKLLDVIEELKKEQEIR